MAIEFANKTVMGGADADAVVEDASLPRMGEKPLRASRAQGAKVMDEAPPPDKGGKNRMPVVRKKPTKAAKGKATKSGDRFPDQVASATTSRSTAKRKPRAGSKASVQGVGDSYLRMRVRVAGGEMSVIDVREVEGPLAMPEHLPSGFAYEVVQGERRVAVGEVPDLGEWRGFPSPKGPPELRVHHITKLSEAEFNVRVPRHEVSLSALPQTEIALYQVKEPGERKPIPGETSLVEEFTNEIREVARLKGIKVDALSKETQKELRRALK